MMMLGPCDSPFCVFTCARACGVEFACMRACVYQVGLGSGCCADGYAANGEYSWESITLPSEVDFPYISVPLCARL